jgi:hypothetical protein
VKETIPGYSHEANLIEIYPNPIHHYANISYRMPVKGHIKISVYNILGQKITTLVDEIKPAGEYSVIWNIESGGAVSSPSGIYYCRLNVSGKVQTVKLIFTRN